MTSSNSVDITSKTSNPATRPLAAWMKDVPDATSLYGLTLPGTHDTCALHGGDAAETQKRTLDEQLKSGIRFIDIRCRHIGDIFAIHHGPVYQKINFGDGVLKVCLDFLKANPSETILMSVKQEYSPKTNTRTFEQTFDWYIREYDCRPRWYLGDTMPSLGDVRGKIVLFRRFAADTAGQVLGLKAEPWPENDTFSIGNTVSMEIQDQYKVATLQGRDRKWDKIEALLDAARTGGKQSLYVNFCSGTSPFCYPYSCANYVNPRLTEYLGNNVKGRFGAVLTDFETSDINRLIAETNF